MQRVTLRFLATTLLLAGVVAPLVGAAPTYRIFLDPGHGGKPENGGRRGGAHWDPLQKRFLNVYSYGTEYRAKQADGGAVISEQAQVLELAKKVRERLEWTRTEEGWRRFEALLSRYGAVLPPFTPVRFDVRLSREDDFRTHPEAGRRDINRHFRIFDCPESLPWKPGTPMKKGRLSLAAEYGAHLVVSLHIDGSSNTSQRGMSALFVPSPETFQKVREVVLGKRRSTSIPRIMRRYWKYSGASRNKTQWMLNDTWTYFTGYRSKVGGFEVNTGRYIGQRWQHVTWAYADPVEEPPPESLEGPFEGKWWDREASRYEAQRRGGGHETVGGDNLYAGEELLRFIRYALWKDYESGGGGFAEGLPARKYLPPLEKPTGSDWAMPLYTNSVAPFLELGQLWNAKDRYLLTEKLDVVADGLAVGLYALCQGFAVPPEPGVEHPKGLAIDWERYRMPDGTLYFEAARPGPRAKEEAE